MNNEQTIIKKIVAALNHGAENLDRPTADKLVAARGKAVDAMRPVYAHQTQLAGAGHALREFFHDHTRRIVAPVAAAALLTFVALQQYGAWQQRAEPVGAYASLLASELPPEAYLDKGFDTWLENTSLH
ncbi:MAG: DUF3619 family protein [Methylobacillus sp.]|jgi:hypothetical protein|nr:DUF3619 family protein [Methylobacillus sp.]